MKVQNFINNSGRTVPNQFIIQGDNGRLFQSYDSAIALIDKDNVVHLSQHWDYSTTTGKYRNQFLNEDKKATEKKIKQGVYKMDLCLNGDLINEDFTQ